MAEWFVEEGIGEHRAIRLENGRIAEARVDWPGGLGTGLVADAILTAKRAGRRRGTATFADGSLALIDRMPADAGEGAPIRLQVTRPAIAEAGRHKFAQARPTDAPPLPAPTLAEAIERAGYSVRLVRRFPAGDWEELLGEAFAGQISFTGGSLLLSPTPAMTLIDVDGEVQPRSLAEAAIQPIAATLRRLDIGGSIGIDFPTLSDKADRRAVDAALASALAGWPHERTAMNGFGFVQLVTRLERPSLLHRAAFQRTSLAARLMLRRAEHLEGPGQVELTAHPAVLAQLTGEWLAELRRRTGKEVSTRADPALAIEAPHAQLVPR